MDEAAFYDAVEAYQKKVEEESALSENLSVSMWRRENRDEFERFRELVWDEFAYDINTETGSCSYDINTETGSCSIEVPDGMTEEEVRKAIDAYYKNKKRGGRPSKRERWNKKIENDEATLEEAREHMSNTTWYKLKKEVEE